MMELLVLFLSGLVTGIPFVVPALSFLGYTALIPLCIVCFSRGGEIKLRRALLWGMCYGMGFFLVIYHWFVSMYPLEFLGFSAGEALVAVLVCWIGLSLLETLHFLIVPFFYRVLRVEKDWLKPMALATLWVLFEWVQTLTWVGVPWSKLALGQYTNRVALQTVSLFGSYWLTFIIVLINGYLALALLHLSERRIFVRYGALALGILLVNHGVGGVLLLTHDTTCEAVRVAAIQANIGSTDKWSGTNRDVVRLHTELTAEAAANGAELVLWPETVITTSLAPVRDMVVECAVNNSVTLIVGCFEYATDQAGERQTYNAMVTVYPDGSVHETYYRKRQLVPFGEYLPMQTFIETFLPVLANMNVLGADLDAGTEPALQPTEWGNVGGMICYDSIYEYVALDAVQAGAELLALITNDSWYLDSAAVWQHNGDSVLRAVESGRYLVSAASTGISAVISPTGEILEMLAPLTEGIVYGDVSFESRRTLYSYIGNSLVPLCGGFYVFLLGWRIGAKRFKKEEKN